MDRQQETDFAMDVIAERKQRPGTTELYWSGLEYVVRRQTNGANSFITRDLDEAVVVFQLMRDSIEWRESQVQL